jgi:hypothetical protein
MAKETTETGGAEGAEAGAKKAKAPRSHGDRAVTNLRSVRRIQNDISDPTERGRMLLAEANVLALLDLADALRHPAGDAEEG